MVQSSSENDNHMGWNVGWKSRDELIKHVTSPSRFSTGYELIKYSIVGNNVWSLVRRPDGNTMIALDLIRAFREKGSTEWGYKGMDECSGPYAVNCPLALLNAADAPRGEHAARWRQEVREFHARRKARPGYSTGQFRRYADAVYRLTAPSLSRRGWIVVAVDTGNQYLMSYHQLRHSELVK